MNKDANNVTKDFIDYIKPLIQGDYQPIMVNGVPRHLVLNLRRQKRKIRHKNDKKMTVFSRINLDE